MRRERRREEEGEEKGAGEERREERKAQEPSQKTHREPVLVRCITRSRALLWNVLFAVYYAFGVLCRGICVRYITHALCVTQETRNAFACQALQRYVLRTTKNKIDSCFFELLVIPLRQPQASVLVHSGAFTRRLGPQGHRVSGSPALRHSGSLALRISGCRASPAHGLPGSPALQKPLDFPNPNFLFSPPFKVHIFLQMIKSVTTDFAPQSLRIVVHRFDS